MNNVQCINNCKTCYLKTVPDTYKDKWLFDLATDDGIENFIRYSYYNERISKPFESKEIEILYIKYNGRIILDTSLLRYEELEDITTKLTSYGLIPYFCVATFLDYKKWIKLKEKFGDNVLINIAISSIGREKELKGNNSYYLEKDYVEKALYDLKNAYGEISVRMLIIPDKDKLNPIASLLSDSIWLLSRGFSVTWWEVRTSNYTTLLEDEMHVDQSLRVYIEQQLVSTYGGRFTPVQSILATGTFYDIFSRFRDIKDDEILLTSRRFNRIFGHLINAKEIVEVENKTFGFNIEDSIAGFIVMNDVNIREDEKYVLPIECSELGLGITDMIGNKFPDNVRFI